MHILSPVTVLRGVGTKKAAAYEKLGISNIRQLLLYQPRSYTDLRFCEELDEILPNDGSSHLIRARIISKSREQIIRKGFSVFKVLAESSGLELRLTFYNTRYTVASLVTDSEVYLYGQIGGTFLRREMSNPAVIELERVGSLSPVYPVCAGITSKAVSGDILRALEALSEEIPSVISEKEAANAGLCTLTEAVRTIHSPKDLTAAKAAGERIALETLVTYSAAMLTSRGTREAASCEPFKFKSLLLFTNSLPYEPTNAQKRVIADIMRDLSSGKIMCRLVQGDVGSGKTLIAAAAAFLVSEGGKQTALMAPTEILAEQHLHTMERLLSPLGVRCALLTGSMPQKDKKSVLSSLANGDIDLLIGTHALFQKGVSFPALSLVITDEQHRFGVAQRSALSAKGSEVHTLVMSATPIPRTLSLILYGDLDVSVINEMPAGRQPISTLLIDSSKRARALGFIKKHLDEGRQAYIVCPLVDESEGIEGLLSASEYAEKLKNGEFHDYSVGLLHGRMKSRDKEEVMRRFANGEIQLLVATTVVEVGVDVPNAVIMLIENAERFGLSQLHQLRGRVGRGSHESYCILVSDSGNEMTRERLSVIKKTSDGFEIAEEDLRLRGPGDILGVRQHGLPNIDLVSNPELFVLAQKTAADILKRDPCLTDPSHAQLKNEISLLIGEIGMSIN